MVAEIKLENLVSTVIGWRTAGGMVKTIADDPWACPHTLGLGIIKHFLGEEWLEAYVSPDNPKPGFLRLNWHVPGVREVQAWRIVDLGELLFNLRHIQGFDDCIAQLRGGAIEATIAELDIARMLFINDWQFRFVRRQGIKMQDYDFEIIHRDGLVVPADAKCNLENNPLNIASIKNALHRGRTQLPPGRDGVLFVKLPQKWLNRPDYARLSVQVANDFLRGTSRVASVKFYIAPINFIGGYIAQGHRFKEVNTPKSGRNWDLFAKWRPPRHSPNAMPPKWLRLSHLCEALKSAGT